MNLTKRLLIMLIIISAWGCSFFKEKPSISTENPSFVKEVRIVSNSVATPVEISEEGSSFILDNPVTETEKPVALETVMSNEPQAKTVMSGPTKTMSAPRLKGLTRRRPSSDGTYGQSTRLKSSEQYQVNSGDTLMKIAFEHYGDVTKWHTLYEMNKDILKQYNTIYPGMILKLGKEEFVVVERNGKPYLIRRNDTLMRISNVLYGTVTEWKRLWENNRQLIHNPNKIYAGFKLYYLPK